jgi:hypothetical protein
MGLRLPKAYTPLERGYHGVVPGIAVSSRELTKLLEKGGAVYVRQGSTDHAIYCRFTEGRRYSAPVQMGKKNLDPRIL